MSLLANLFRRKAKRQLASAKLPPITFDKLPPDIAKTLRAASNRIKGIVKLRGTLAVIAALLISILAIMAIDVMVTIFNAWIRWTLTGAGLAAGVITAWNTLIRPLSKPFTPGRIAAFIEAQHPELEERLSTVVEILSSPGGAQEGTTQLLNVLTQAAVADAKNVSPRREFTTRTVKPKFIAAACAIAIFGTLFAIWPKQTWILFGRATVPSAKFDNIWTTEDISIAPGDITVLKNAPNSSVTVNIAVRTGVLDAKVRILTKKPGQSDRREIGETLPPKSKDKTEQQINQRHYSHTFHLPQETIEYRISCGRALTRYYTITVVPPPAITSLEIRKSYPEYTGIGQIVNEAGDMRIEGVAGTKVEITAIPERELKPRYFLGTNILKQAVGSHDKRYIYTFELQPGMAPEAHLELSDKYHFTNKVARVSIGCVKDQPPQVRIYEPKILSYRLPPYDRLTFSHIAQDDFKVERVEMRIKTTDANAENNKGDEKPFSFLRNADLHYVSTNENWKWVGADNIDLIKLNAKHGQRIRVQLVAYDNLPPELGGPQTATAGPFDIIVDKDAVPFERGELKKEYDELMNATSDIEALLQLALADARAALVQVDAGKDPAAVTKADDSRKNIAKADSKAREMMTKALGTHFEFMIPDMKRLLTRRIEPAEKQAAKAVTTEPKNRRREVVELIRLLEKAVEKTEDLKQDIKDQNEKIEEILKLEDLKRQEEELAEHAEEMDPEEFKNKQEEIQEEFKKETEKLPDPVGDAIKQVNELREKVEDLIEDQEALK
ncbi:MAG: hypothetical protein FWG05_01565, partial [Kiritimatiellaeota bacterium]|nr:hypothetical protein [Kiritimatiellota bacterium]